MVCRYLFVLLKGATLVVEWKHTPSIFVRQLEIGAETFLHRSYISPSGVYENNEVMVSFRNLYPQLLGKGASLLSLPFLPLAYKAYQVVEKFIYMFSIACPLRHHTMAKNIVGIGFETEQLGEFSAQVYQSFTRSLGLFCSLSWVHTVLRAIYICGAHVG